MVRFLSFFFNDLICCLKMRQIDETGQKQGKIRTPQIFSARLSTETVDSFPLASSPSIIAAIAQNRPPPESPARV
jgi:hypothetical protein